MALLSTGCPEPLTLLGAVMGDHERAMHKRFASIRKRGEWFAYSPDILAALLSLPEVVAPQLEVGRKPNRSVPPKRPSPPGSLAHGIMDRVIAGAMGRRIP